MSYASEIRRRFQKDRGVSWTIAALVTMAIVSTTMDWLSNRRHAEEARRHREAVVILESADDLFKAGKYFDAREKYSEVLRHASTSSDVASLTTVDSSALVGSIKCNAFIGGDAGIVVQIGKIRELGVRLDLTQEATGLPQWLREHACSKAADLIEASSR